MKKLASICVLFLFLLGCKKDDPEPEGDIIFPVDNLYYYAIKGIKKDGTDTIYYPKPYQEYMLFDVNAGTVEMTGDPITMTMPYNISNDTIWAFAQTWQPMPFEIKGDTLIIDSQGGPWYGYYLPETKL